MANNGAAITLTDKEEQLAQNKAQDKQANLDRQRADRVKEELKKQQQEKDVEQRISKSAFQLGIDARNNTLASINDTELPNETSLDISANKASVFNQLLYNQEKELAASNLKGQQDAETYRLEAEQAKRKAKDVYWQGYDSLAADAVFSGGKSLSNIYKAAYNLDIGLDADLNVNIPRNLNDSLEKNDLATRHRNEQIDLNTQITAKHLNAEYNNLEEGLKLGFKNLITRSASLYPAQFIQEEQAMIDAFSAAVKDRGDYTKSVDGGFNALLSGTARLADDIYNLARSAAMSASEGKIVASHHTPWANMLQNWFGFSYTPSESMLSESKYNTLDKFSWGYAALTLIESFPEMAMLWAGLPSGFKNLSLFGKGSLNTLKTVSDTTIARAQKALYKKAAIVEVSGASGAREAAQTLRALADDLPKKFSVGTARNSAMLKSINSALEGAGTTGIRASTLTRNEFARMAGRLAGYAHIGKLGTSAARYTKGTLSSLPIKFLTFDWARRTIMLAGQRGDGSEVTWEDAGLAAIHQWVDVASLLGGLNAFTRPLNPTNSGRQFLAALGIDTVGGAAIEGFGEVYQTYVEQAAKSGHTIPYDWMTLLGLEVGPYAKVGEEMTLAGLLGAAGGAMLGGASGLLAPVAGKISDTINNNRKNLWEHLDKFGKDITDTTDPSLGTGTRGKLTDIGTWADEDIAKATKARESTEASMKKAAEDFEKAKATFGAGSKEAMAAEKKVKDIDEEHKTNLQKEKEAKERKDKIKKAEEEVEKAYKTHGIKKDATVLKDGKPTQEKIDLYYGGQQSVVQRAINNEEANLEELMKDPAANASQIKDSQKRIEELNKANENLEFLKTQQTSMAFEEEVEKNAMAAAKSKGKSDADIKKLEAAFEKARKAKNKDEYTDAMREIAKISANKGMYTYLNKLLHKDAVEPKIEADSLTGTGTGRTGAKPSGTTSSASSGMGAAPSSSSPSSATTSALDDKIYEDAISQLDGETIAAIIAMYAAAEKSNFANINEHLENVAGISSRIAEYMRTHTFVALEKDAVKSTSGAVKDKSIAKDSSKSIDISRFTFTIVDNDIVSAFNDTNESAVEFIPADTRTLDFLSNPLQNALEKLQQGKKKEIDNTLKAIKDLLSKANKVDINELTSLTNTLNGLFKENLLLMRDKANMLNYLLSKLPNEDVFKKRLSQIYNNMKNELENQRREMDKVYNQVRTAFRTTTGVIPDITTASDAEINTLIESLQGLSADPMTSGKDEFSRIATAFSKTTSQVFAGVRELITQLDKTTEEENSADGKGRKSLREQLSRIFVNIGKVLRMVVEYNNSKEMVELYSQTIAMLKTPGTEYILQHQTEGAQITLYHDVNGNPKTITLNSKIPFLRLAMERLFSGFYGRMYTADIVDTILPKILDFNRFVIHTKGKEAEFNEDGTEKSAAVEEKYELNEEALRALAVFRPFLKNIKIRYNKTSKRFVSLSTINLEEQNVSDIVEFTIDELLYMEDTEMSTTSGGVVNTVPKKAIDILGVDSVAGKTVNDLKLECIRMILDNNNNESHKGEFNLRLKEAINSQDIDTKRMVEQLDLMLDIGLFMQAYQITHSTPEKGVYSPFLHDDQLAWAQSMFDDTQKYTPAETRAFYNMAMALANEYGETKTFHGNDLLTVGPVIGYDDGGGGYIHGQGFSVADGLREVINDQFREQLDQWIETLTAKVITSNNVDDIVFTISQSGLPINRKLEFINELQSLGKQFDDETVRFIERIIGANAHDTLLQAMQDERNVLDEQAYNRLKSDFISSKTTQDRFNRIFRNPRNFFGNYVRVPYKQIHRYTYKDTHGRDRDGEYVTNHYKYVYIDRMSIRIENTGVNQYRIVANNDEAVNRWIQELDNSYVKDRQSLCDVLLNSTNITPSEVKSKEDEVSNSVLDAITSINAEFGFFYYALTNRHMNLNGGKTGAIYTNGNDHIKAILDDHIDYSRDVFYRYQMQPDGRISAVSADNQGNKLFRILKSVQPERFFTHDDLVKINNAMNDPANLGRMDRVIAQLISQGIWDDARPAGSRLVPNGDINEASTQYGIRNEHGRRITNNPPRSLREFRRSNIYSFIRENQLMALARVFGLDPEKFTIDDLRDESDPTLRISYNYKASFTISDINLLPRGFAGLFARYIEIHPVAGSTSAVLNINVSNIYEDMLSDNVNIRRSAADFFNRITRDGSPIRQLIGLDDLTFRGDHKYQSIRNQEVFENAIVRDAAGNITDINVHLIDNRRFSLYFDGTSTLYFQYGVRFFENILGDLVSGISRIDDATRAIEESMFDSKARLERIIRDWIAYNRRNRTDTHITGTITAPNPISEDALNKLERILDSKGIDGHTLPLFLFAASHAHLANVSFLIDAFINSPNLGDRNSIKKVMTPIGYNAAIESMINSVHDSLKEYINPTMNKTLNSFIGLSNTRMISVLDKTGQEQYITIREALDQINNKKGKSQYDINALKHIVLQDLLYYINECSLDTTNFTTEQRNVLNRFFNYYNICQKKSNYDFLFKKIYDSGIFNRIGNNTTDYYSDKLDLNASTKLFNDIWEEENNQIKKYTKYFGGTTSALLNSSTNKIAVLNRNAISFANIIADLLEKSQVENSIIFRQLIRNEWIDNFNGSTLTLEINGKTAILHFGTEIEKTGSININDLTNLKLQFDGSSEIKSFDNLFHELNQEFKGRANPNPPNGIRGDIDETFMHFVFSNDAASNLETILSNTLKFKIATGDNLQTHIPIGLQTNPLLMLPREVADRVEKNMQIAYKQLIIDIITLSTARFEKFKEEWKKNPRHIYNDDSFVNTAAFKEAWDRENERLTQAFISHYLEKVAWSKRGGYVSPYTRNPSIEMRKEHYETVKQMSEVISKTVSGALLSQGSVSATSAYTMLTNFGKKNSIIPPGTNALFNQPFEAFVVSQMRGIDNQTFDAVESNGVVFSKHLRAWNKENSLYTIAFDSANIAYKALAEIKNTVNYMETATDSSGSKLFDFKEGFANTTIERLLTDIDDNNNLFKDYDFRAQYLKDRLDFLARTIETIINFSPESAPRYSLNAKFATPEKRLGGASILTDATIQQQTEKFNRQLQDVLNEYFSLVHKIETSNHQDAKNILNRDNHESIFNSFDTTITGRTMPNSHGIIMEFKDNFTDGIMNPGAFNNVKTGLSGRFDYQASREMNNAINNLFGTTIPNTGSRRNVLHPLQFIIRIIQGSASFVRNVFGLQNGHLRYLKTSDDNHIIVEDLSGSNLFFDNKLFHKANSNIFTDGNLINQYIDNFSYILRREEDRNSVIADVMNTINRNSEESRMSLDDIANLIVNKVYQKHIQNLIGTHNETLFNSANLDKLIVISNMNFKESHNSAIANNSLNAYPLVVTANGESLAIKQEDGINDVTIDLANFLQARDNLYIQMSDLFHNDIFNSDRSILTDRIKNIYNNFGINYTINFVNTVNGENLADFTSIRAIYNKEHDVYFLPPREEGSFDYHRMIINSLSPTNNTYGMVEDNIVGVGYGAKPSRPSSRSGSTRDVAPSQLKDDIDSNIDQMINDNQDIAEELGIIKTLVNTIWDRLAAGLRVFYYNFADEAKGFFTYETVDESGKRHSANRIEIWSNADEYTRLHEFIHAVTHFASHHPSNKVNILMSRLYDLQQQVKRELDVNEKGISAEEKIKRQQLRDRIEMTDEEFNYMFAETDSYSVHALSEFMAAFISEPKKIRYLSQLTVKQSFPSSEGKNKYTTTLNGISASAEYLSKAVGQSLRGNKGLSAFALMSQAIFELSQYNNEEGRKQMLEQEEGKTVNRINKQIVGFAKDILGRVSKDDFAKAHGISDVNAEMNRLFDEYIERDETINAMLKYGHTLRGIENPILKNFALAGWLLGTFVIKAANFFNQNPIQREAINEATQQVRELVLEKTFFDTLIKLDFGVYPTQFLKDNANLINRAASLRNSYDFHENQARSILEQQVRDIIDGDPAIKDILDKSPEFREKYETALFRAIQFSNIGDYFLFNEEDINSSKIDQAEVSKLARLMLNIHKNDKVALNECRELAKQKRAAAFESLGIKEDAVKKSISKLVIDLAKARNSDETNRFGTSNIEMGLKQLGFKEWNRQAFNALHQAITLEAIAYPYRKGNERDANSVHVKETRKALVEMQTLAESPANPDGKLQKALTQSIENLIRLHAQKTRQVNNTRVLNYKTIDKFLKPHFGREKFMNQDLYLLDTSDRYHVIPAFEMKSMNAYNLDSHKFYKYNKDKDIVPISPEDPPVPQNVRKELASRGLTPKDLSVAEKQKYFKWAKENYKAKGYKPIAVNGMTGDKAKYVTDSGVEIWTFDNKWYIDQKTHREERMFIKDNNSHKGRISYILNAYEYQEQKDSKNIEYSKAMHEQLLDYGKDYTDNYIPKSSDTAYGTRLKTKGGSSTILQFSNLTAQEFEHITDVSTSIVDSFGEMESQIHRNKIREFYNDQIFYHVIQMDKEIRNRPYSLDSSYNHEHHHTEVLFTRSDEEGKTPKWNFNKSLIEKYGLNMSPRDEEAFAKLWAKIPESEKGKITDGNIYVDSRLIPIMFGREKFSPEEALSDSNPTLYKVSKTFKSIWQSLLSEFKNTIIIRNPKLIYINAMGNFAGLIGEGIPVADTAESWSHYANELNRYNKDVEQKFKIENTLSIFERDFSGVRDSDKYQLQMPDGSVKEISGDQYKRLVDSYKRELNAVQQRIELNPVHPLVKAGFYSNLIEDSDSSTFKWWDAGVEWVIKNLELDEKRAYALKEVAMTEDSDIYKTAGHLTRMGDFIPRVVLYYHLRDKGLSHPEALDEARNRFVNYNTPMWSSTMYNLEQAGLVMFSKYRMAIQYQILQAFKNAPLQASAMLGSEMLLEASGIRTNPLTSYLGEIGEFTPSGVLSNGLESVLSNGWRWKFIEQFSDDVDSAVLGLAS